MSTISASDVDYVRGLVHESAGLVVEPGKDYLVESRLSPLARQEGFVSIGAMVARIRLETYGPLHHQIVEAMTTNETSWFRDTHPFEALRTTVLPDLIERRAVRRQLTIWSAACSTGQEPYSVAMMLRDSFPDLAGWHITILASDLSEPAVARARAGRYSPLEVHRGLGEPALGAHFVREGSDWVISDDIRRMVRFGVVNLVGPWAHVPMADIVLLRNVMIYFDLPTKRTLLGRMRQQMNPDGYLFLGNAETTLNIDDGFVRVDPSRAGCYQLRRPTDPADRARPDERGPRP